MEQWKIVRDRGHQSAGCCDRPKPADAFAVLELPGCTRRDYCPMCFGELQGRLQASGGRPPIFWRVKLERGRKGVVLDLALLRHLFDRLGEEPGERPAALRYFVTLLLLRKRVLKMADPTNEVEEAADLVVVDPKAPTLPPVALFAPAIEEDSLAALKDELLALAGSTGDVGEAAGE